MATRKRATKKRVAKKKTGSKSSAASARAKSPTKKAAPKKPREPRFAPPTVVTKTMYSFNYALGGSGRQYQFAPYPGMEDVLGRARWPCGHSETFALAQSGAIATALENAINSKNRSSQVVPSGAPAGYRTATNFTFRRYENDTVSVAGGLSNYISTTVARRIVLALRAIQTAVDAQEG